MMKKKPWYLLLATLGPIGSLPASGTAASLCALPLVLVKYIIGYQGEFFLLSLCTLGAYIVIGKATSHFSQKDPSPIVLDELIGLWWAFIGLPLTWRRVIGGLVLFRIFDITKFPFLNYVERAQGASGILFDDIIAGLLTNIILWIMTV